MPAGAGAADPGPPDDEAAIARYRYMLRTAPPEAIEQAHAEAFARLTPEQRRKVLEGLGRDVPDAERNAVLRDGASAGSLARAATRAEIRRPGLMERVLGSISPQPAAGPAYAAPSAGPGFGGLMGGTLLSSLAGTVIGSAIGQHFFTHHPDANRLFGDRAPFDRDDALSDSRHAITDPWGDSREREVPFSGDPDILADPGDDLGGFDDGGSVDA